mmetsp:Transcript_4393/g.6705  ORF Transcript_4393/g.6705 Transcript_4393/m.6705 type:complete len:258 (+) Transcript_4393:117-890(+)
MIMLTIYTLIALYILPPSLAFQVAPPSASKLSHRRCTRGQTSLLVSDGGNFFDEISEPSKDGGDDEMEFDHDYLSEDELEAHIPKINCVNLVGRIGQQPEPRYFDDGKVVLRLSLACRRKYHPLERLVRGIKSGEEETDWFNLELWGRDAEYAGKYVTKGARVGITGSLSIDSWSDRLTGEERSGHKVVVKHLDILESKAEAEMRMGRQGQQQGYGGGNYGNSGNSGGYSSGGGGGGGGNDFGDGPSSGGTGGFFDN